jgi:hypothetical protein
MDPLSLLLGLHVLPVAATALPPPVPTTLVVIGCRVDDFTGQPGRHDPNLAAKGWKDLEWHINKSLELECKRDVLVLEDAVAMWAPRKEAAPLNPDWSQFAQCSQAAMSIAPKWEEQNQGWAVMAVGCPRPVVNIGPDGTQTTLSYHLPECPRIINQLPIKCRFDESVI